jgi:myo-inositol-1(or 4)-monophosphatase
LRIARMRDWGDGEGGGARGREGEGVTGAGNEMPRHLRAMFQEVREFLLAEGITRLGVVQYNVKGDVTKEFDFQAEARIIDYCARELTEPVRILTEERGEVRTRPGPAAWTLIVDPVDGSENFARGNAYSSVSLAILPGEAMPHPDAVEHALVGRIFDGARFEATRGRGAFRNGAAMHPAEVSRLTDAVIGIDFFFAKPTAIGRLDGVLRSVKDARRFGSAAGELAMVGCGGLDGYVDVRDSLSPENYMAAVLIIREAGGVVSDRFGGPLAPILSMAQGQSLVAACTPALHAAILAALAGC